MKNRVYNMPKSFGGKRAMFVMQSFSFAYMHHQPDCAPWRDNGLTLPYSYQ